MNRNFRLYGGVLLLILLALFPYPVRAVAVPFPLALVFACSLYSAVIALECRKSPLTVIDCTDSTSFFYIAGAEMPFMTTVLRQDQRPVELALPYLHCRSNCVLSTRFEEI